MTPTFSFVVKSFLCKASIQLNVFSTCSTTTLTFAPLKYNISILKDPQEWIQCKYPVSPLQQIDGRGQDPTKNDHYSTSTVSS